MSSVQFDVKSYQKALGSNRALQNEINRRLEELRHQKCQNRQKVALLTSKLVYLSSEKLIGSTAVKSPRSHCEWHKNFFRGPNGSTPEDNEHTVQGQKFEKSLAEDHMFPWSKQEIKVLREVALSVAKTEEQAASLEPSSKMDYTELAEKLSIKMKKIPAKHKPPHQRSAKECEQAYNQHCIKESWTFEENEKLVKTVEALMCHGKGAVDWDSVARQVDHSAWACFLQYQKSKDKPQQPWTGLQDELLFKYVAALGPQIVLDGNEIDTLLTGLFRDKTKQQILTRINNTLLNPNLKHDSWTEEEERRLGLCMKIYSDQPKNALLLAATHVHGRSGASVADKWNRSLNPAFSARPFSKQDDDALLRVFHENPRLEWREIAQKFPDRSAHRLMNRFMEIATDKDLLLRFGDSIGGHGQDNVGKVVQVKKRKR